MNGKMVFCDECRRDVAYTISNIQMVGTLKGEQYTYVGKEAQCLTCGSKLYIHEINDGNLCALYDVYREKKGIISQSSILEIPEKYAIGKRPLSLLLGWGEQTFTRYCEGDMPTKQYSDILRRIYEDPHYYMDVLERNRNHLKSDATYEKSKKAVCSLLEKGIYKERKIDQIIAYLLWQCADITPLALQKALYYMQGFYYAFYQTFLFSEDCEAWVHGPVYRDIYVRYRNYQLDDLEVKDSFDVSVFSASERAVLESVVNHVCCYSGKVLEAFTHGETPWLQARGDLPKSTACDRKIQKEMIGEYFYEVKKMYQMKDVQDIKKYTEAMFQKM